MEPWQLYIILIASVVYVAYILRSARRKFRISKTDQTREAAEYSGLAVLQHKTKETRSQTPNRLVEMLLKLAKGSRKK
jgi:hypothetical protein